MMGPADLLELPELELVYEGPLRACDQSRQMPVIA